MIKVKMTVVDKGALSAFAGVRADLPGKLRAFLQDYGMMAVTAIKRLMRDSKPTGNKYVRKYTREGKKRRSAIVHVASAPGEPPAIDTGHLWGSIEFEPGEEGTTQFVDIGTNVEYGLYLEEGTGRMARRPWLLTGIEMVDADFRDGLIERVEGVFKRRVA